MVQAIRGITCLIENGILYHKLLQMAAREVAAGEGINRCRSKAALAPRRKLKRKVIALKAGIAMV